MGFRRGLRSIVPERAAYSGYPRQIKALIAASLINSLGRALAFPYLAIYLYSKLGFEPSIVGTILLSSGLASLLVVFFAGSLADKIGRKKQILISYGATATIVFLFYFIKTVPEFLAASIILGIAGALGDPASMAMVADLLPPSRREEVYGLLYQVGNVGTVIGPLAGGILILGEGSYGTVFLASSALLASSFVLSTITFTETYSVAEREFLFLRGLREISSDRIFLIFCGLGFATSIVYVQLYGLLSVNMNSLGLPAHEFGILFSINGLMVVLLQIPIRQWVSSVRKTSAFILAQSLYTLGFSLFALSVTFPHFLVGVIILTVGEIIFAPAITAFIANLAPSDKRGRYIGFSGIFFGAGSTLGTFAGFYLFGVLSVPSHVWVVLGFVGLVTTIGYVLFGRNVRQATRTSINSRRPFPDGL